MHRQAQADGGTRPNSQELVCLARGKALWGPLFMKKLFRPCFFLCAIVPLGCTPVGEIDGIPSPSSSVAGGAADGAGGQVGAGGDGGTPGPPPECLISTDCDNPIDPICGSVECIEGKCVEEKFVGALSSQIGGDCKLTGCAFTGELVTLDYSPDIYDDGKECTYDICTADQPVNKWGWQGSTCPDSKSGYCYEDRCVECVQEWKLDKACTSIGLICDAFKCVPLHCTISQTKDGDESDINCGGSCNRCPEAYACNTHEDCNSSRCVSGKCATPTCTDAAANGNETDVDCGGPSCGSCAVGNKCNNSSDCASSVCWQGLCGAPACTDGVKNGEETGIDCGGPCSPCAGP